MDTSREWLTHFVTSINSTQSGTPINMSELTVIINKSLVKTGIHDFHLAICANKFAVLSGPAPN